MWTDASRFARVRPETVVLIALRIDPKAVPVVRWLDPVLQQASKQARFSRAMKTKDYPRNVGCARRSRPSQQQNVRSRGR